LKRELIQIAAPSTSKIGSGCCGWITKLTTGTAGFRYLTTTASPSLGHESPFFTRDFVGFSRISDYAYLECESVVYQRITRFSLRRDQFNFPISPAILRWPSAAEYRDDPSIGRRDCDQHSAVPASPTIIWWQDTSPRSSHPHVPLWRGILKQVAQQHPPSMNGDHRFTNGGGFTRSRILFDNLAARRLGQHNIGSDLSYLTFPAKLFFQDTWKGHSGFDANPGDAIRELGQPANSAFKFRPSPALIRRSSWSQQGQSDNNNSDLCLAGLCSPQQRMAR